MLLSVYTVNHKCQCTFYENVHNDLTNNKILKTGNRRPRLSAVYWILV